MAPQASDAAKREDETLTKEPCRHCGVAIPDGAQSCPVCGAPVDATPTRSDLGETAQRPALTANTAPQPPGAPAAGQYTPYPVTSGVWAPPGQSGQAHYPPNPAYPTAYPGYYPAYPAQAGYPQAQPYGALWAYYAPQYSAPAKRAPGETYALVISWIVTSVSGISVLCGLLVTLLALIGAFTGSGDDLSFLGAISGFSLAPVIGGAFGLWYGILGIRRKTSPRFSLPNAWLIFGLTVLAIGGGVALWQYNFSMTRAPGTAFGVLPLAALTGALPALAILAFTTQRLHNPSSRRRVWMSLFYGMTLAPLIAVILEFILSYIIVYALNLSPQEQQSVLGQPGTSNLSPAATIAMLLVLSVVAPIVEEGAKPLGALLAIRRLRTPGEAFLVGLAAGVGFDILETIGYIGQGQADWISVAIDRVGAGLLHGVGAGMGALGWYYLINGQGVPLRWLRGIGCGLYAVVQHGVFNAFSLIGQILPANINNWLNQPFYIGDLPISNSDIIYLGIYLYLIGFLLFMTHRLLGAKGMPERKPPLPVTQPAPAVGAYPPYAYQGYPGYSAYPGYPAPTYPAYPAYPPSTPGASAPAPDTQQPLGGAR